MAVGLYVFIKWKEMMKKCIIFLSLYSLSGCIFLYREGYSINRMAYWENIITHEKVINEEHKVCASYARIVKRNNTMSFQEDYGKCMYENGFLFKTSDWLYCYHRKEECKVYDKYRK